MSKATEYLIMTVITNAKRKYKDEKGKREGKKNKKKL
jgi:hypothetical protein